MNNLTKKFLEFNGKTIDFLSFDGQYWIAIKPLCDALNINYKRQHENLKSDPILGQLSAGQGIVAADGKTRIMLCLPEKYIYGWLFSIQSSSTDLIAFKKECYDILFNHFHGSIAGRREIIAEKIEIQFKKREVEKKLQENELFIALQDLNAEENRIAKSLKQLDSDLIKEQLDLFNNE